MLEIIRQNAASWLMKFILGAIVVVFIFWGVGTFRSGRLDVLAKVNGEKILVEEYQKAYNAYVERLRRLYGGNIPEQIFKMMNVKEQVLNQLIDFTLIKQKARSIGLFVTDKEIQHVILGIPSFKQNGVFDRRLYEMALRNARMTPVDFENQLRQEMLTQKLMNIIGSGLYSTDSEALSYFKYQNAMLNVDFLKLDASSCVNEVNATESRLKKWYEEHKETFRTDPQIKIKYLLFAKSDFEKSANVTDDEIKTYYQEHKEKYYVPEMRRARHILIKVPNDANATVVEAAKKKLEEIKQQIDKGASFEKLAKKYSEDDATKEKGGDLGYFKRGVMVKPFDEAVFSMKKGEVKGPIRTTFGWHLIKLEDVKKEHYKALSEVKDQIKKLLLAQKVKRLVWDEANKAYDMIIELGSLEAYAKAENKKLKESEFFSRKRPASVLGVNPTILDMVFSLQKGELSSLLEVPKGVLIAEVVEKKAPYIQKFEKVKKKVEEGFTDEESLRLCRKKAKEILEYAKKNGLEKASQKYGLKVQNTGFYKRQDHSAKGKLPINVAQKALSLSEKKPYPDDVVENGRAFYVIHLKGFKDDADLEKFKDAKKTIKEQLRNQKVQNAFANWLKHQREKAKIEILRKL